MLKSLQLLFHKKKKIKENDHGIFALFIISWNFVIGNIEILRNKKKYK